MQLSGRFGPRSWRRLSTAQPIVPRRSDGRLQLFATYGLAGLFSRHEFTPPALTVFGFGYQSEISRRAAVRIDVQGSTLVHRPVSARFAVGLSIPFAPYQPFPPRPWSSTGGLV